MSKNGTKLSTFHLTLLSTGGIIGAGWLFSPYYGFQMAGVGVLISWIITAILTCIIAFSFAEVASILPIVGGISRFIGVTHNRTMAFLFLGLSWLSYVVYLPVEAQSATQYLGFWWQGLIVHKGANVELSLLGLGLAFFIIIGLTWFNTLFIRRVARANSFVSIWKLIIPLTIALGFIIYYGKWDTVVAHYHEQPFSFEKILLAITTSGLAFAFAGFQNGLVLANSAKNPIKAIPYSLFAPIIFGGIIYFFLSVAFVTCLPSDKQFVFTAVAPLLGLVALFGVQTAYVVLFIDAIMAPLGTANVFTAVTGRVLYGLGRDFLPNSILLRLNKYSAPYICLWISGAVGMCFLLPFPTWKELVNFLSSVTVFAYLAGPIALIILRKEFPNYQRNFKVKYYNLVGYLGFACCGLLIYWSGLYNLCGLSILVVIVVISYTLISKSRNLIHAVNNTWIIIVYMFLMTATSYLRHIQLLGFPEDNLVIIFLSFVVCGFMVKSRLDNGSIGHNLVALHKEIIQDQND